MTLGMRSTLPDLKNGFLEDERFPLGVVKRPIFRIETVSFREYIYIYIQTKPQVPRYGMILSTVVWVPKKELDPERSTKNGDTKKPAKFKSWYLATWINSE